MAENERKADQGSEVEKAATEESKAASKVAKAAKGTGKKSKKSGTGRGEKIKKFFKDYRGERRKIVWPDAKMVLKSTGIVILVVAIVSLIIFGIDQGLSAGITGLKKLAINDETTNSQIDENAEGEDSGEDSDADSEKDESKEDSKDDESKDSENNDESNADEADDTTGDKAE